MPETSVKPTLATATTGKSLIYAGGGYWGAWSGLISATDTETTLLEFTSPETALVANIRFFFIEESGDDMMYKVYLNDLNILAVVSQSTSVIYQNTADFIYQASPKLKPQPIIYQLVRVLMFRQLLPLAVYIVRHDALGWYWL